MTAAASVRIGVIGRGFGSRVVAPVFDRTDGCRVLSVVSARDDEAVAELCRRDDIDLVAVHSPPFLHLPHVRMAVEAGRRAVLCDKPFGRNAGEAATMVELAERAGTVALVNFQFRFGAARSRLRQLIGEGKIGRPEHMVSTTYLAATREPLRPFGWLFDAELGGGWIGAGGSHTIDCFRWLFGDVVHVGCSVRTAIAERPGVDGRMHQCSAEDGFTAVLQSSGGVTAAIDGSFASPVSLRGRTTVFGSEGTVDLVGEDTLEIRTAGKGSSEVDCGPPEADGPFRRWAEVVRDAVTTGTVPAGAPTFTDGLACARTLDRMRESGYGRLPTGGGPPR